MLDVIFGAALRSLAMGALVLVGLKLFRIRGAAIERAVWAVVLAAALLMPVLMQFVTVTVPAPATSGPEQILQAPATVGAIVYVSERVANPAFDWKQAITWVYLLGAGIFLIRLAIGVILTARLWWRARPLSGDCESVRTSADVRSPVVFGRTILLPGSPADWEETTRRVVLAHERAHVAHGDFFVLLAAKVYRAVFWFSPLSWWLDRHLGDLMETVCDEEAVREASDRQSYAAVLLQFAAQDDALDVAVAMARTSTLARRIDRILCGISPSGQMSKRAWGFVTAAITVLALAASVSVQTRAQDGAEQPPPPPPPAPPQATRRRRMPPPPPPPPPAKKSDRERNAFWWQKDGDDEPYAIVSGDGLTMSGSSSDARRARLLRGRIKGDYIWFERDLKFYYIDDAATVARAKELFQPQEELGRKQAELGAQQAALGQQQARLGAEEAAVSGRADMERLLQRIEEVRAKMQQVRESSDRSSIDQLQSEIGQVQAQIGSVQSAVGEQRAKLGEQQAELGGEQAKLGQLQAELGRQQAEISARAAHGMKTLLDEALSKGLAKKVE